MKHRIVFCLFLLPFFCFSQIDSTYIQPFKQNSSARIYLVNKYSSLSYEYDKPEQTISYKPNTPIGIGLGGSYKNTGLNIAYGFNFMRNKEKGKTRALDLQYHHYGRKFIFDVFFQNYKGFYKNYDQKEKNNEPHELFPDMKLTHIGLFGQYLFNHKKFSYKAAFNHNEKQIKSAGTLLVGGGFYYNRIRADSTFVLKNGDEQENYQLGVNTGYAYTVVFNKFYITGSLSVGVNIGTENPNLKGKLKFNPTLFPRFSAGYNSDTWSVNLSFINSRSYILMTENSSTYFDSGKLQLAYIQRFDFPFKKKN